MKNRKLTAMGVAKSGIVISKDPIYWYLRSARGNYGLWLYYQRLDKDILFKALLNYVEPKIRLEEDRLNTLRSRNEAAAGMTAPSPLPRGGKIYAN